MRVPASLVRTEAAVAIVVLTVHDIASEIRTEETQWRLLKVDQKAVINTDGRVWNTHIWPQVVLVVLLRRVLVFEVEAGTGQQHVVLENLALRSHVLQQVLAGESRRVIRKNRVRQTGYLVDKRATVELGAQFSLCTVLMRTVVGDPGPRLTKFTSHY